MMSITTTAPKFKQEQELDAYEYISGYSNPKKTNYVGINSFYTRKNTFLI